MTPDQLRAALRRTLLSYGIVAGAEFLDELASIADHHAAEEVAAAFTEAETTSPLKGRHLAQGTGAGSTPAARRDGTAQVQPR